MEAEVRYYKLQGELALFEMAEGNPCACKVLAEWKATSDLKRQYYNPQSERLRLWIAYKIKDLKAQIEDCTPANIKETREQIDIG